jgi:hypothetical protein
MSYSPLDDPRPVAPEVEPDEYVGRCRHAREADEPRRIECAECDVDALCDRYVADGLPDTLLGDGARLIDWPAVAWAYHERTGDEWGEVYWSLRDRPLWVLAVTDLARPLPGISAEYSAALQAVHDAGLEYIRARTACFAAWRP